MSRFDYRKLTQEQRTKLVGELLEVMGAIKNTGDLQTFFLQLVTPSEAVMLARRWQIAKRLANNQSYYRIAQELKVGLGTVEAVDQWLSEAIGDYRERLTQSHERAAEIRRNRRTRLKVFPDMPAYLLLNLLIEGTARLWWTASLSTKKQKRAG